jgi:tetratricopeptide (TPR) repeat protein
VTEAVHRTGRVAESGPSLAFAAARALLADTTRPEPGVVRLAETLAAAPALAGSEEAYRLYGLAAAHHEALGDVVETARVRALLAETRPGSAPDLAAAALACTACGEYVRAEAFARRALAVEEDFLSLWATAAALDGLGRYGDADGLWDRLDSARAPSGFPADRQVAYDVARAEAHLARGGLGAAAKLLEGVRRDHDLVTDNDELAHQVNAATVQLATLRLQTSRARDARALALTVVEFYRDRSMDTHVICREAELVRAEATVSLDLFELRPDTSKWSEAEETLRDLYESYRSSAGPASTLTLKAAVQYALVLVRLGRRVESRAVLREVLPALEKRFGEQHPLRLRTRYILGVAHLQLCEFDDARQVLEKAWSGQRTALGPHHYETLRTQLELGIVLKFFDQQRMRELITDLRAHLPEEIGRRNDLYGRATLAQRLLFPMPASVAKMLWRSSNLADERLLFRKARRP